jgi:hypothetical protein
MTAIEKIKSKLAKYPGASYSETPTSIEVHPEGDSGFTVGLSVQDHEFTVQFDGWHETFASEEEPSIVLRLAFLRNVELQLSTGATPRRGGL